MNNNSDSLPYSEGPSEGRVFTRRGMLRATTAASGIAAAPAAWIAGAQAARAATVGGVVLPRATPAVTPFEVRVPESALMDLRARLRSARLPEHQTVGDWSQGAPLDAVRNLVAYWREHYDWRRLENRLNGLGQYRTEIDGLGIHFLHVRSRHAGALPIVLTHGWPGSVIEFLKVIGPLTDPTAHGGKAEDAFHVVVPSLPGHGFSDRPTGTGWGLPRIARAWDELMRRLGYGRYVAQGGDWGAGVTTWMGKQRPAGLAGIHLNLPILFGPPPLEGDPTPAEQKALAQLTRYSGTGSAYALLQATRPQTLGYGLADSPVGQAAWIYEKFGEWTDSDHRPERVLTRDEMLDDITLYWLTDTAASSARLYAESFAGDFVTIGLDLPVGVSVFPGEIYQAPRIWAERTYSDLFYWNDSIAKGGHFAAFEQPRIFVDELRACFRSLR